MPVRSAASRYKPIRLTSRATASWLDQIAIPAHAPQPDEPQAFPNYIQKPEVIAKAANDV